MKKSATGAKHPLRTSRFSADRPEFLYVTGLALDRTRAGRSSRIAVVAAANFSAEPGVGQNTPLGLQKSTPSTRRRASADIGKPRRLRARRGDLHIVDRGA